MISANLCFPCSSLNLLLLELEVQIIDAVYFTSLVEFLINTELYLLNFTAVRASIYSKTPQAILDPVEEWTTTACP